MIKYILHPGYVISQYDGDIHYISAHNLATLFNIDDREWIDGSHPSNLVGRDLDKYIHLYPREDGKYDRK